MTLEQALDSIKARSAWVKVCIAFRIVQYMMY